MDIGPESAAWRFAMIDSGGNDDAELPHAQIGVSRKG